MLKNNVSPIVSSSMQDVFNQISADFLYVPLHLTADPGASDDQLSSKSSLASAPAFTIAGTLTGVGANDGWATMVSATDTSIKIDGDSAIDGFFRTDTLETGQCIIASVFVYVPSAGATTANHVLAYGNPGSVNGAGLVIAINPTERVQTQLYTAEYSNITSGISAQSLTTSSSNHIMGVIEKTATGFICYVYVNGALGNSSADTAGTGYGSQTDGLSIFHNTNTFHAVASHMEADFRMSDLFFIRSTGDISAYYSVLAAAQAANRMKVARKWGDVL